MSTQVIVDDAVLPHACLLATKRKLHPFHFPAMHPGTKLSLTILMSLRMCKEILEQFMHTVYAFLKG